MFPAVGSGRDDGDGVGVDVGDIPGISGIGDGQAKFGSAA